MNNNGQANQASGRSQNAKYESRAGKSNRKRPLLPPVGISGTAAPNKNRSLLRLVRQLSQKCLHLYFGWKKWLSVYSSSLLLNMYLTRTRPIWALCSVTVVLGYVGIEGTKNVKHQRMKLSWAASYHKEPNSHHSSCKEWGLESAVRFRDEPEERRILQRWLFWS